MIYPLIIDNTAQINVTAFADKPGYKSFSDEVKALNAVENEYVSVVLLHYQLRQQQTPEYITLLLKTNSNLKIVVIGHALTEEQILSCLVAGAKGYQEIDNLPTYAIKMVDVVNAGEAWVSRRMVAILLDKLRQK